MMILGIETSCDETSAAVVESGRKIVSNVILSQMEHETYGGVVPEIASRAHVQNLAPVVESALEEAGIGIDRLHGIAVTRGPGLPGSLIVGLSFAKVMAGIKGLPLMAVNHLEAHLTANFIGDTPPQYPFLALLVSGGHTCLIHSRFQGDHRLIGTTLDDAAGEAFDKISVFLGLGYPGGAVIEKQAECGSKDKLDFPRAYLSKDSLDFSFSGLKTAVSLFVKKWQSRHDVNNEVKLADIAASFQEAAVDVLIHKLMLARKKMEIPAVVVAGGVACNNRLRAKLLEMASAESAQVFFPRPEYCTDNGAMIAMAGYHRLLRGEHADLSMDVRSKYPIQDILPTGS